MSTLGRLTVVWNSPSTGITVVSLDHSRIFTAARAAYGFIMTISKFAEAQGIMKYICQKIMGASPTPIEYKRSRPGLRRSHYESEQNR